MDTLHVLYLLLTDGALSGPIWACILYLLMLGVANWATGPRD